MRFIVYICLFFFSLTSSMAQLKPEQINPRDVSQCTIYFASALFSMREKNFNARIVSQLENKYHYKVFLPQRDGFEFVDFKRSLSEHLDKNSIIKAEQLIIYYLDMGYFLPKSNVIISVLDEDLDPGLIVEITYGKLMAKYIIGIRTDVRSPYGQEPEAGAHFFPIFQLDDLFYFGNRTATNKEINQTFEIIANVLNEKIKKYNQTNTCSKPPINILDNNPFVQNVRKGAEILFGNLTLEQINSPEGVKIIVDRYLANRQELEKISPGFYSVQD